MLFVSIQGCPRAQILTIYCMYSICSLKTNSERNPNHRVLESINKLDNVIIKNLQKLTSAFKNINFSLQKFSRIEVNFNCRLFRITYSRSFTFMTSSYFGAGTSLFSHPIIIRPPRVGVAYYNNETLKTIKLGVKT